MSRQDRVKEWLRKRRESGLCPRCGGPRDTAFIYCTPCRDKQRPYDLAQRKAKRRAEVEHRNDGKCQKCGGEVDAVGRRNCATCRAKGREGMRRCRERTAAQGLCPRCHGPRDGKTKYCGACLKVCRERGREVMRGRIAAGLCGRCERPAVSFGAFPMCFRHWLVTISRENSGDANDWRVLERLWLDQHGCCAYTGEKLVPGMTASLDHKMPVARGGTSGAGNLHWVLSVINTLKRDLTHEEFIGLCDLVVSRQPDDVRWGAVSAAEGALGLRQWPWQAGKRR